MGIGTRDTDVASRVATHAETPSTELSVDVAERILVPAATGSPLALSTLHLAGGASWTVGHESDDGFLFVTGGSCRASDPTGRHDAEPGAAFLVPAGETAELTAHADGLSAVWAQAGPGCDLHAPLGPASRSAQVDHDADSSATGNRSFQVLFDATNGSHRATLFVGYVPPGRAPWHFHQYDEIVSIVHGSGRLHLAGGTTDLEDGSTFRLHPREVHIVENLRDDDLVLLGLFTPAGSPAAAYLADAPDE